jgi:cell wall-associated NlpC family hydrolase
MQLEVAVPLRKPPIMRFMAALVVLLMLLSSAAYAAPTTPQIEAKKAEASKAQAKLDEMRSDLEIQVEEYNRVNAALKETRLRISETRARLEVEDENLRRAKQLLYDRADGIYRGGTVDMLAVMLGTTSFEDFLTRVDLMMRIGTSDAQLVGAVKDARQAVTETKQTLERRESEQVALRGQADAKRQQVEGSIARQDQFLKSLNGEIAQLIKQEEERLAAEAAARAKALAEAQARAASQAGGSAVPVRGGRTGDANPGTGHPEIVGIAMKYLGVPYVWGGEDPSGFDCSGLAQYTYKQIGIDIPRVAQDQYYAGKHIDADRLDLLKPGDLLFFGRGRSPDSVHHVVIYAGGDNIIEAPYSGANVRVASLSARLEHGEYVGASRF